MSILYTVYLTKREQLKHKLHSTEGEHFTVQTFMRADLDVDDPAITNSYTDYGYYADDISLSTVEEQARDLLFDRKTHSMVLYGSNLWAMHNDFLDIQVLLIKLVVTEWRKDNTARPSYTVTLLE